MFILKFDGYYPTTSNNNQIIVNKPYNYKITVEYDDKNHKRFIQMKNTSAPDGKRDCSIELDNIQAFIVQDFLIFIQIDNSKPGIITFVNYTTGLSAISTLIPKEYKLDVLNSLDVLYYGKLFFLLSGINVVNKVEVLEMDSLEKSAEKINMNDLESIVNAIDFRMNAIDSNNKDKEIKRLNEIVEELKNELKNCESENIIPEREILMSKRYIFTGPMQKYEFGNSISDVSYNSIAQRYEHKFDLKNTQKIIEWWESFENKYKIKKENLIMSDNPHNSRYAYTEVSNPISTISDNNTPLLFYELYNLKISKLEERKYKIEFIDGESSYTTLQGLMINTLGVNKSKIEHSSNGVVIDNMIFSYYKYSITIDNVKIKTDKIFKFDDIDIIDSSDNNIKRFIQFEWDVAKGNPIINMKDPETQKGINFIQKSFPKLLDVLREFIVN